MGWGGALDRVDVVVAGSDLCGVAAAVLFRKSGFEALLIDESRRLGGRHCYLPLTTSSLRLLGCELEGAYTMEVTDEVELHIKLSGGDVDKSINAEVSVVDVSNLCEYMAGTGDVPLLLWSSITSVKRQGSTLRVRVDTPSGSRGIEAPLLIDTRPRTGGGGISILTCPAGSRLERGHIAISGKVLELSLRHGSLVTVVSTAQWVDAGCRIACSEAQIRGEEGESPVGILRAGEPAGHAAALWIGDALLSSSYIAYRVGATYLAGVEDSGALERYLGLQRLAEMGRMVIESSQSGCIDELPLSFVEKVLDPWVYRELLS